MSMLPCERTRISTASSFRVSAACSWDPMLLSTSNATTRSGSKVGRDLDRFSLFSPQLCAPVHEMLLTEAPPNVTEEQLEAQIVDELEAYNPLLPNGHSVSFTLFFEVSRSAPPFVLFYLTIPLRARACAD